MKKRHLLLAGAAAGCYAAWRTPRPGGRYLQGKVALITGGSRGLGLELARQFAGDGYRIAICARNPEDLDRARQDLLRRGAEVLAVSCDLREREQVEDLVATVREFFGRIDLLVNNAGVIQAAPMEETTLDDYDEAMKVHFWAPLWLTRTVVPETKRRGEGRIVNLASIGGKIAIPHLLPYDARTSA